MHDLDPDNEPTEGSGWHLSSEGAAYWCLQSLLTQLETTYIIPSPVIEHALNTDFTYEALEIKAQNYPTRHDTDKREMFVLLALAGESTFVGIDHTVAYEWFQGMGIPQTVIDSPYALLLYIAINILPTFFLVKIGEQVLRRGERKNELLFRSYISDALTLRSLAKLVSQGKLQMVQAHAFVQKGHLQTLKPKKDTHVL